MFGANWQTTISGIGAALFAALTFLAGLPYETGGIAEIFPIEWKPTIFKVALAATVILKIWNAYQQKSKAVTGGSVQQDLAGDTVPLSKSTLVNATEAATPFEKR